MDSNQPILMRSRSSVGGKVRGFFQFETSVKVICLIIIFGYFLSYFETVADALIVTPGYFMPPLVQIWTAFTFCFVEKHLWEVLVDIATVALCGKLIEPLWGSLEMMTYFAVTNFGVVILTTTYYLFLYACTKNPLILFEVHIYGLAGYIAAVCVAVHQIMPDHLIARTPIGNFTNRNIPLTLFLVAVFLWLLGLLEGRYPTMFLAGIITSWIYLRFIQRHRNGSRGDYSENFAFVRFFPIVLQPFVSILVNPIYYTCRRLGIIKHTPVPPATSNTLPLSSVSISMGGVDPYDMERRRQIALKALNERLSKATDSSRSKALPKSFPQSTIKSSAPAISINIPTTSSAASTSHESLIKFPEGEQNKNQLP
ncbi:transmembrane protein 115 [Lutzomyia longipalpis]|uniref:Protein with signal anchor n=1 Tax=Lutzomyia longipalpis TaxID=7200 RepID=A0A1B0C991_LUTLO|nr:transmembrane protein 115 [Lutzomyia longipalpis]